MKVKHAVKADRIGLFLYLLAHFLAVGLVFQSTFAYAQSGEPPTIGLHHDTIPNPCHSSVYGGATTIAAVADGNWSVPANWNLNRIPNDSDIVFIPTGRTIRVNDTNALARTVCVHGELNFLESSDTKLISGNIAVFTDGFLRIGTVAAPIAPAARAEVVFRDTALNTVIDPSQYLSSMLILGKIRVHGAQLTPTWVRLAAEPQAGQSTLQLAEAPTGWRIGDRVMIPGSRQERTETSGVPDTFQFEERIIQNISGTSITLTQTLQYAHPGARDMNGHLDFLPHVGNLTRNVILRSQTLAEAGKAAYCTSTDKLNNPASCVTRAHTMFLHRADVDVRYAAFRDLGRTLIDPLDSTTTNPVHIGENQIGRYPIHMHHLFGPLGLPSTTPQFTLIGNSIDGGSSIHRYKWGAAIHGSHYGQFAWNVIYNMGGAGVMTEDGSESYNVIEYNFVVRTLGDGARETRTNATEGVGYYFRGPNNYVRYNVAANQIETNGVEAAYGMKYNMVYLGNIDIPNFKGADTTVDGEYTTKDGNAMALLQNIGNELYGSIQGITLWWLCSVDVTKTACDQNPVNLTKRSVIKDLKLWHISRYSYYGYPQTNVTFDGWVVRGDPSLIQNDCCEFGGLFWWGDYATHDAIIKNMDVQGIRAFILPYFASGTTYVADSFFEVKYGLSLQISHAPGSCPGCTHPARRQIFRNNRFAAFPGKPLGTISMDDSREGAADIVALNETYVCDHNGVVGDNFQLSFLEQNASFLLDGSAGNIIGCPGGTMTNQQCWTNHHKAYAGFITPCTSERPASSGFQGYICANGQATTICNSPPPGSPPPGPPRNLRVAP